MLALFIGLTLTLVVLMSVVAYQRRNGNKGTTPAPHAGVHDFKDHHG